MVASIQSGLLAWTAFAQWVDTKGRSPAEAPGDCAALTRELLAGNAQQLCGQQWLPAVAHHLQACLEQQLSQGDVPAFFAALAVENALRHDRLEATLLGALRALARAVEWHLAIIEAVTALAIKHTAQSDYGCLDRVVSVREAYLQSVAAMLLPLHAVSLNQVLVAFFAQKLAELQAHVDCTLQALLTAAGEETSEPHDAADAAAGANVDPDAADGNVTTEVHPWRAPLRGTGETDSAAPLQPQDAPWPHSDVPSQWQAPLLEVTALLRRLQQHDVGVAAVAEVARGDLLTSVQALGRDWLEVPVLGPCERYMRRVPLQLQQIVLSSLAAGSRAAQAKAIGEAALQLRFFLYDTIGRLYCGCMFEITMGFPDTEAAVLDCAACLKRTSLHQHLVDSLREAVRARLLHPGVATESILDGYINAIKVLQRIDGNGILMTAVTHPIKAYLRSRPDTIRCVVKMLTQEGAIPGVNLLADMRTAAAADGPGHDFEDLQGTRATLDEAAAWVPTAVELDNVRMRGTASFDIITTLVDIYGDALFINERMLGAQLMRKATFDVDFEARTLELLKLRFVESELHPCDVMLKDIQNSRRHLQSLQTPSTGSAAALRRLQPHVHKASLLICSQLFWPKLPDSQLELRMPGWLQDSTAAHAEAFHLAKNPRKLFFSPALGVVELELEIGGVAQPFTVSPILAVVILQFAEHASLSAAELSDRTGVPQSLLLKKAVFWVQHGALVEERMAGGGLRYRRPAAAPDAFAATGGAAICEDPEDDDLMPSRSLQPAKENGCNVFLPLITQIMTSAKTLTLERLQRMLVMMGQFRVPKYDRSEDELLEYLDALVERGIMKCEGSLYSLKDAPPAS